MRAIGQLDTIGILELAVRAHSIEEPARVLGPELPQAIDGRGPEMCDSCMCPHCRRVAVSAVRLPRIYTCPGCSQPVIRFR